MTGTSKWAIAALAIGALAIGSLVGCEHHDKPHNYGKARPPVEEATYADNGLQSKDVVAATDQMAQDLLALPELNESRTQWTIVFDHVENHSSGQHFDMDIFLERLKQNLSKYGHGRVTLIENKAKLHDLQNKELEAPGNGDEYGQGGGGKGAPGSAGIQPDYALYAKIYDLPNRATDYYNIDFVLTNMRTRVLVWDRTYEVKVAR